MNPLKILDLLKGFACETTLHYYFQASASLGGITSGTLLGMYILGMLFPWANSTGALVGGIASASLVGWISIGTQVAVMNKEIVFPMKSVSVEGCVNVTMPLATNITQTVM